MSLLAVLSILAALAQQSSALHLTPDSFAPCTYTPSVPVRILDCSTKGLTDVPSVDPAMSVNVFYLDGNAIATVGANAFANLSATLTLLSVKSTALMDRIDGAAFTGLTSLTSLTLDAQEGSQTSMNAANIASLLSGLKALTTLSMTRIKVAELPVSFAGTTSLTDLSLVRTAIASINPQAFTNASNLRALDLSYNSLAAGGGSMAWLGPAANLETGVFTNCGITAAYLGQIPSLSRLKKLDFSSNSLDRLASSSLENVAGTLEELVLSYNSISEANTAGLAGLTALKKFTMLSDTQLSAIPPQVKQLPGLEMLDLRGTNVAGLEADSFHALSSLRQLKLDYTQVRTLHSLAFAKLTQLEEFTLAIASLNTVRILDSAGIAFPGNWSIVTAQTPHLQVLSLSGTDSGVGNAGGLTDSIWTSLQPLSRLRRLTLDYNSVAGLPDFYLSSAFVNLTYVSLRGNSIERVTSAALYGVGGVQLQLQDNRIAAMDNCTLAMYASLATVSLGGNPFACTCALQWLWLRLQTDNPLSLPSLQCSQPAALAGRAWSSLTAADFCSPGEVPPNNCSVLVPPTAPPTTPHSAYQLASITVSKASDSSVSLEASVAQLAAHFNGYAVKYWPVSRPQALLNTSLLPMTTGAITLQVTPNELYRYCYVLVNASWLVESPANCRDFTLSGLANAAVIAIAVLAAIIGVALIFVLVCLLCKRARRRQSAAAQKARAAAADEDPYTYTYPDEKPAVASSNSQFQATLRPESKRFSKRSRNNLAGSRPSLATSTTTLATASGRTSGAGPGFAVQNGARPSSGHSMALQQQQHHPNPQFLSGGRSLHSVADDPASRQHQRDHRHQQQHQHQQQMMSRSQDHLSSSGRPHPPPSSQRNSGGAGRKLPAPPPRHSHSQELVLDVTRVPALPPGRQQHQQQPMTRSPPSRDTVMTIDYDDGSGGGGGGGGYVPMSSTAPVLSYPDVGESSTDQQQYQQYQQYPQSPGYNYNNYLQHDQLATEPATPATAQQRQFASPGGVENTAFQRNDASGYYEMGQF